MDFLLAFFIIAGVVIVLLIGGAFIRNANMSYRIGKGMFQNSEHNLDEPEDVSDKEYYDGGKGLMK